MKTIKFLLFMAGAVSIAGLFWFSDSENSEKEAKVGACAHMRGDNFKIESLSGCIFEAKAEAYNPTRLRKISFSPESSVCLYSEQFINEDAPFYSETVKLSEARFQRSSHSGKRQLVIVCEFEKFRGSYYVFNEGDFSPVEVDGDPNGGFWVRKLD